MLKVLSRVSRTTNNVKQILCLATNGASWLSGDEGPLYLVSGPHAGMCISAHLDGDTRAMTRLFAGPVAFTPATSDTGCNSAICNAMLLQSCNE
jgi:hypothetical protein